MNLSIEWRSPVSLKYQPNGMVYYDLDDEKLPSGPGVYVFARKHGKRVVPIYIGRAQAIRTRIRQHLVGNVALMKKIEEMENGARVVLAGVWKAKPGQRHETALPIIEKALIKQALAAGHDLLNIRGKMTKVHEIKLSGNKAGRTVFGGGSIKVEQK